MTELRTTYARRKAAGICADCNEKPPAAGRVRCEQCLADHNASNQQRNASLRRRGICIDCHKPKPDDERSNGLSRCHRCRERQKVNRRNYTIRQVAKRKAEAAL